MIERTEHTHGLVATGEQKSPAHLGAVREPKTRHVRGGTAMAERWETPAITGANNTLRVTVEPSTHGMHPDIAADGGILAVDLYESADEYVVTTMVPGLSREDVIVSCDAHTLTLVALIPDPTMPDGRAGVWRIRELGSGPFARWIPFTSAIVPERVQTRFASGLLTIRLPKAE